MSLLPEGLARHYESPGMIARLAVSLPGAGTRYEIMTRSNRPLAPAADAFVAMLAAMASRQRAGDPGRDPPAQRPGRAARR